MTTTYDDTRFSNAVTAWTGNPEGRWDDAAARVIRAAAELCADDLLAEALEELAQQVRYLSDIADGQLADYSHCDALAADYARHAASYRTTEHPDAMFARGKAAAYEDAARLAEFTQNRAAERLAMRVTQ